MTTSAARDDGKCHFYQASPKLRFSSKIEGEKGFGWATQNLCQILTWLWETRNGPPFYLAGRGSQGLPCAFLPHRFSFALQNTWDSEVNITVPTYYEETGVQVNQVVPSGSPSLANSRAGFLTPVCLTSSHCTILTSLVCSDCIVHVFFQPLTCAVVSWHRDI